MVKRRYWIGLPAAIVSMATEAVAQTTPPSGDLNTMILGLKSWIIALGSGILIFAGVVGGVMCVKSLVKMYYVAETEDHFFRDNSGSGIPTVISLCIGVAMSILGVIVGWSSLAWVTAG